MAVAILLLYSRLAMTKVLVATLGLGALGIAIEYARPLPPQEPESRTLTSQHMSRAVLQMDPSPHSEEYRQSIEFLRANASEAVQTVSGYLFEEKGSFRKWQLAYLIGEFGDEAAIHTLSRWVALPLAKPDFVDEDLHRTDLDYSEEVSARAQAVSSIATIASRRSALRDQAIDALLSLARESPGFKGAAFFELRMLLGPEFETLRSRVDSDDARHFEPFMPPPEWQGLLQHRMAKHQEEQPELVENRERLCRLQ